MHFFILGAHPKLGQAELVALDPAFENASVAKDVVVADPERPLAEIVSRSASVVKAGDIFSAFERYDKDTIAATLLAAIEPGERKVSVGLSVYDAGGAAFPAVRKDAERLGMTLKALLKSTGRPVRLVTSKDPTLSAVVVKKNHLLEDGAEFVLLVGKDSILLGQTSFVQDFEAWGLRDFGRPARNAKAGMLPPKLARLMVNLAGEHGAEASLWDPFCGSGTVLMEAALLGWNQLVGSDIEERAVADTQKNMRWVERELDSASNVTVLMHDATGTLPEELGHFDAIVTEGSLGPPQRRALDVHEAQALAEKLTPLYKEALPKVLSKLKPHGTAVIAFPFFQTKSKPVFLPLSAPSGYTILPFPNAETPSGGLLYARADQFVGREIVRFSRR